MRVTRSVIPNLFTVANLFCGFASVVASFEGRIDQAIWLVVTAGIFDMLDGVVARITHSTSEFGVELDSLCDAVSFGVAPSVLLYVTYPQAWQHQQWTLVFASLPAIAGVLRLARFNVQLTSMEDKLYFRGMPIPAGALTILAYIHDWHIEIPTPYQPYALALVTVIVSLAMVSTIKYDNLPRPSGRSFRQRPLIFSMFIIGIIACIATSLKAMFPFMALYLVGGALRHALVFLRDRNDDDDSVEESDPDPLSI